jgi:pimeloyl-ACP methyl ester carboxylesterase
MRTLIFLVIGFVAVLALVGCMQRKLLYFPTHARGDEVARASGLTRWQIDGEYTGYARVVPTPRKIWLVVHGNGGQAAQRGYVLAHVDARDCVFVLEYPGYGERPGSPSKSSFDTATRKAYDSLVRAYGVERIVVLGESLGSGPVCELSRAPVPPKHLVLIVPFDVLTDVAQEKFSFLPVGLVMLDRWNNVAALQNYTGRVDIFGGTQDRVIPVRHARNLAASHPGAVYHEFPGSHDWSGVREVDLAAL